MLNCLIKVESFITKDNIDDLISPQINDKEIDFLSVEFDGNDDRVLDAIAPIRPGTYTG